MDDRLIRLYLMAEMTRETQDWGDYVCGAFDSNRFDIFKPWEFIPSDEPNYENFSRAVFETEEEAIIGADAGLLLAPFDHNAAWACGWFRASGKPVIAFVQKRMEWLSDWLVKGGLNVVVTDNKDTCLDLMEDPVLHHESTEIMLVTSVKELPEIVEAVIDWEYDRQVIEIK